MTRVVQATCPGCHRSLHIPTVWIPGLLRCKFCGLTFGARLTRPLRPRTAAMARFKSARRFVRSALSAGGSWQKGLTLGLSVLAVALVGWALYRPQLSPLLERPGEPAVKDTIPGPGNTPVPPQAVPPLSQAQVLP